MIILNDEHSQIVDGLNTMITQLENEIKHYHPKERNYSKLQIRILELKYEREKFLRNLLEEKLGI